MILYKAQIKYLKSQGVWPVEFDEPSALLATTNTTISTGAEPVGGGTASEATPTLRLANMRLTNSEEQEEDADDEDDEDDDDDDVDEEDRGNCEIFKNTNRYGTVPAYFYAGISQSGRKFRIKIFLCMVCIFLL